MKRFILERRGREEAVALWCLALCIPVAGGWAVQARYEKAIGAAQARAASYYQRMLANERILQQANRLRRLEHLARRDLQGYARGETPATATARFLSDVDRVAAKEGVRVTKIEPAAEATADPQTALTARPVELTVNGGFVRLLPFLAHVTRESEPLEIRDVRFAAAPAPAASGAPVVEARISAVLYALPAEADDAPNRR